VSPPPWYRFGTRCTVLSVQIVHGPGHIGNDGRSETHRRLNPLGWGPKGRWFKSSRPDYVDSVVAVRPRVPIVPPDARLEYCFALEAALTVTVGVAAAKARLGPAGVGLVSLLVRREMHE
jgi:hypothetical protein